MNIKKLIIEKYNNYIESRKSFIESKKAWNNRKIPKEDLEFDRDFKLINKTPYVSESNIEIDNINMENRYSSEWFELRHQFGEKYMFLRFKFKKMNDKTLDRLKFVLKYFYDFEISSSEINVIKESYNFIELYVLKPISFGCRNNPVKIEYKYI